MIKKWKTIIAASLACLLLFCGCGTVNPITMDEAFIKSLSQALEARWKLSEQQENNAEKGDTSLKIGSDEHVKANEALVNAEWDKLSQYADAEFEDPEFAKLAKKYLDCLEIQRQALIYAPSEPEQFEKDWSFALANRCVLLATFVDKYGLSVNEKYQSTLDDLLKIAESFSDISVTSPSGSASAE